MENGMILNNPVLTLSKQLANLEARVASHRKELVEIAEHYNGLVIAIHEGEKLVSEYKTARDTLVKNA